MIIKAPVLKYPLFCICALALFVSSCKLTRNVPEGDHLLTKNVIKAEKFYEGFKLDKDEMELILKQKPNRTIIKYPFYLYAYNFGTRGKQKRFLRKFFRERVGEEPVILDTTLTIKSATQLKLYLKNKGYFHAEVKDTTIYKGKKATVIYTVNEGKAYKIRSYSANIDDSLAAQLVDSNFRHTYIIRGQNFDMDNLEKERERVARDFKNNGYYFFTKDFLDYWGDSSNYKIDLKLELNRIELPGDTLYKSGPPSYLRQFLIKDVFIDMNFNPKQVDNTKQDTLFVKGYQFLYNNRMSFKPEIIMRSVFFQQGDYYNVDKLEATYQSLGDLRSFKFINILFVPDTTNPEFNMLNCYVQLYPSEPQSYTISSDGTNSAGNLGVSGVFTFQNKNTFRGAEIFEIKMKGGIEAQKLLTTSGTEKSSGLITTSANSTFNTIQLAPEASLSYPKLFLPFIKDFLPKKFKPRTSFSVGYNYQRRPDFTRNVFRLSYYYTLKSSEKLSHVFTPSEINFIRNDLSKNLEDRLEALNDIRLKQSFANVFITSAKYSLIFSGQDFKKKTDFFYLRFNFEIAGILPYILNKNNIIYADTNDYGAYEFFGNKLLGKKGNAYSHYVKPDIELRYYDYLNDNNSVVYRIFSGVGVPFKNSKGVLPFQKSFFAGGTNDIRAWRALQLGPGSFLDTNNTYNHIGDIKLEANVEYRFPIYKYLKGALFVDAGNIFLLNTDATRPGGKFEKENAINKIGIGSGFGLRLDFSYFVIRFDAATVIRDPALEPEDRWSYRHIYSSSWNQYYLDKYQGGKTDNKYPWFVLNFGIGYPF